MRSFAPIWRLAVRGVRETAVLRRQLEDVRELAEVRRQGLSAAIEELHAEQDKVADLRRQMCVLLDHRWNFTADTEDK